jgi:amino acid adenylation domain-containing protein/non-ribosomal peptide synthase protein (TIGR01720 family)
MLSQVEQHRLLFDFNDTGTEFQPDKSIIKIFEEQVEQNPGNPALILRDTRMSYGRLNERVNRLARVLINKGVKPGDIVAIMAERSIEMITGILAILKAGGAYLPIDPDYPPSRVKFLLEDSNASILLTHTSVLESQHFTNLQGLEAHKALVHLTPPRPQITDMDSLPFPDRSLVDYEKYSRFLSQAPLTHLISLQGTRGCPYGCAYCYKIWPKKHVFRSAENIFEEVHMYYKMGVRRFSFVDDIFNLDVKNSSRFFQLVVKHKLDVNFSFLLRGDIVTEDYIDLMIEAGVVILKVSLETASRRLQKMLGKNLDIEKLRHNLQYVINKYPHVIMDLNSMHGFPTETEEEAMSTLDFIKDLKWLHFPYVYILKIYPNTEMEKLALRHGITQEAINNAASMAYHELTETLPFSKEFTLKYQSDFFNNYFLSKERLAYVLPYQMNVLTEWEMVKKYSSYLPVEVKNLDELFDFLGVKRDNLSADRCKDEELVRVPQMNEKIRAVFPKDPPHDNALKILLLDVSQHFTSRQVRLNELMEPPLGLMYLWSYLKRSFGPKVNGKIAKSMIDFNSFEELKQLLDEFKPDVIGIRCLTFYHNFFHRIVAHMRQWGVDVPVISGGPYASSDYRTVLRDGNLDLVVVGEGEITFNELIGKMLENDNKLPPEDTLKQIPGLAFVTQKNKDRRKLARQVIMMDTIDLSKQSGENPPLAVRANDLAYTIYTSGSTGQPKGVLVEHRNVINTVSWWANQYHVGPGTHIAQLSHYAFDASVNQIFATLLHGGCLHLIPGELIMDMPGLREYIRRNQVNVVNYIPAIINELLGDGERIESVNAVLSGGERLDNALKNRLIEKGYELYNQYGPTETTIDALVEHCGDGPVTLGKPIANVKCYILDRHQKPVPIGAVGELYVGGAGVARGYLNNPELTARRFINFQPGVSSSFTIHHPPSTIHRLYRTGDLARWLPDGRVQFLGRIDHQVKIRGNRVELGEIQEQLLTHQAVNEAVVTARTRSQDLLDDSDENLYLCSYYVPDPGVPDISNSELEYHLGGLLPDYMVPHHYVKLTAVPRTTGGKVDVKALPSPFSLDSDTGYVPPESDMEKTIASVWREVFALEKVGIHDNFFKIGGDSIKAIQISARLQKSGFKVEIGDLFMSPTIAQLGGCVKTLHREADQGIITGDIPLTPLQHWFFDNEFTGAHHLNMSVMFYKKDGFNQDAIEKTFTRIMHHHDALRMTFVRENGRVIQRNPGEEGKLFDLSVLTFDAGEQIEAAIEREATDIQRGINLETGPLVRLGLFKTPGGDHLLVVIHHLVVDAVSWRILLEDFSAGYNMACEGKEIKFQHKTDSFKFWMEKLLEYAETHEALSELPFWRAVEETDITPLPLDHEVGEDEEKAKYTASVSLALSKEDTQSLLTRVHQAYNTRINDILLAALGLALREWRGVNRCLVALEGHGREPLFDDVDVSRTVAWFTTQYPVLLDINPGDEVSYVIKRVKESLRKIPNNGIGYGILKYLTAKPRPGDFQFRRKTGITFNYLGQVGQEKSRHTSGKGNKNVTGSGIAISPLKMGNSMSPELERRRVLDIIAMTTNGRFNLTFNYNGRKFEKESIEALCRCYKDSLMQIIHHCMGKEEYEMTPSDVGYSDLSIEELQNIESLIN